MTRDEHILAMTAVQFFGKMTASATHEIKNTLAIINESAGLVEDLSQVALTGPPLPAERILDTSRRINRQVQRADQVLRKLNQFSHSVDRTTEVADLGQTLGTVLDLGSRLIERTGVKIQVTPPVSPLLVSTNVIFMETLIWRAIETSCNAVEKNHTVAISFSTDPSFPGIWVTMEKLKDQALDDLFGSNEDFVLLKYLGVTVDTHVKDRCFGLIWPEHI